MAGFNLPQRRLVSQEDAAMNPRPRVPRSKFSGTWSRKTTFDAGWLVPFMCNEILPGDFMRYRITAYIRMATLAFPMMDSQRIDTHFFFVPMRLLWSNWARFMGEQDNPTDSIDYTIPTVTSPEGGFAEHSIFDHFFLPTDLDPAGTVSVVSLPLRAYMLVYHEWFRDQSSILSSRPPLGDGPDLLSTFALRRRAKSADYFTSALPWPQRFTAPTVAISDTVAPVRGIASSNIVNPDDGTPANHLEYGSVAPSGWTGSMTGNNVRIRMDSAAAGGAPVVYADLSALSGFPIDSFRQAFLVQELLERNARGGTRYGELVWSHFDVRIPDFRLQRPEYIGGGSSPLNVTPIAQTVPTEDLPVGTLGAAGTSVGEHSASFAATEHGYIIGIISVKSELSYQQALHPMWTRETRYDYPWPELAGLSEQAIYRREIYPRGTADDEIVFGYQERYHEFRTHYSEVTGLFRSAATGTMDQWHLAQNFGSAPVLGATFLNDDPPMSRVLSAAELAVNQQYQADILIRREAVRPLPTFGVPVTLSRF